MGCRQPSGDGSAAVGRPPKTSGTPPTSGSSNPVVMNDGLPMRSIRAALSLVTLTVVVAACGQKATPGSVSTTATSPTTTIAVDQAATPSAWVPVAFGDVQVSVPATWDIVFGCPIGMGSIYLGGTPKLFCQNEPVGTDVVVLGNARTASSAYGSPAVVNGISVQWLDPDDTIMQIPSLNASVSATGPLGAKVFQTVTYSPRAVVLASGTPPVVPTGWHRVSFGGLSAAVPKSWPIDRRTDWPIDCVPVNLNFSEHNVLLSAGTAEFPPACPNISHLGVPTPMDGFAIDPGPDGPLTNASFGSCLRIHGLRVCPTRNDLDSVLVFSANLPRRNRPTAVEIGLAGSGLTARTILDSLRAA